ncbi:MAG: hypothetical protein ACRCSN_04345 [Dermatophilaceae bacterium]
MVREAADAEAAGLLSGLLDDPLNKAFDVDPQTGFEPTWDTALTNVVGSLPVPIVIDEPRAEVAGLRATELQLPRAGEPRPHPGRALAGCGRPSGTTVTPKGAVRQLDDLPELRAVPDADELRGSG